MDQPVKRVAHRTVSRGIGQSMRVGVGFLTAVLALPACTLRTSHAYVRSEAIRAIGALDAAPLAGRRIAWFERVCEVRHDTGWTTPGRVLSSNVCERRVLVRAGLYIGLRAPGSAVVERKWQVGSTDANGEFDMPVEATLAYLRELPAEVRRRVYDGDRGDFFASLLVGDQGPDGCERVLTEDLVSEIGRPAMVLIQATRQEPAAR